MSSVNRTGSHAEPDIIIPDAPVVGMNLGRQFFQSPETDFYQRWVWTVFQNTTRFSASSLLETYWGRMGKRVFDMLVSFFVVVLVLSWLLPIIALFIKFKSKGPVFFLQKRTGRDERLFSCIKFRTMIVNNEADLRPATANDPRITSIGKFLRNHYLDELPQFINVLLGDMSIIGPRPHMISDDLRYEEEIGNYDFRHKVKPGITGLAQTLGFSGPVEDIQKMKDRVNLDIFYIRHWSLMLDIKIIFRTILKLIYQ